MVGCSDVKTIGLPSPGTCIDPLIIPSEEIFEELHGKVEYFGKPYAKVYSQATDIKNRKVLCIGDNLNTDIRGANFQNFYSLLISNGIHREEIKAENINNLFNRYDVKVDFLQSNLKW